MTEGRRHLYSESDVQIPPARLFKRESIAEYLTSRRGSLSDLVFTHQKKVTRDTQLANVSFRQPTRHASLSNINTSYKGERSTSLSSISNTQQRNRGERRSNSVITIQDRKFIKTKSLNSINYPSVEETKRNFKCQLTNKRKRWLRKIQSVQAFDSALKSRQGRRKHHVSSTKFQGCITDHKESPLVRFRRAARTILLLLKAIEGGRQGRQHDHVTWSEMADEQSTAKRTYDLFGISFDPTIFKAKREKSLGNEAKAILNMPPPERTEDQIRTVLLGLNQTVDAFGEFPIKLQRSLASVGWYENFEAKRVIIRQGHMADNFYFILSGTAIVSLLETNKDTGDQAVRTVAFLRKGNSFGELALMHGARRSATVTCKTNVELLAVSREDFVDIFMHIEKDKEPDHIQFLRSIDILKGWPMTKLPYNDPRICLFTYFRRGVLLCKDSNQTEWIYIIKTGSCRVLKDLFETKPNIPGLENIPYTQKQVYVKLPPIPHVKTPCSLSPYSPRRSVCQANGHKSLYRRLPVINSRSSVQSFESSTTDHQNHINEIYDKRHKIPKRERHTLASLSLDSTQGETEDPKVFVQILKLGARDVFGLEQSVFGMIGKTTGCSLVSDGAECILINKKFFLQHLTDDVAKQIRKTVQPIPTEESLQQKLQDKANWDAYKSMTVSNFIVFKKQLHNHEMDYMYF